LILYCMWNLQAIDQHWSVISDLRLKILFKNCFSRRNKYTWNISQ
jgi:hypothetical protein